MEKDALEQLVDVIEQAVIGVIGEEFVVLAQTEDDCFTIKLAIPKENK